MFGRILILIAITGLMLGTHPALLAQEGVAASSVGAATSAAAGAAPVSNTLWRFLGIPQGLQRMRDGITNRRGNRPRLERKPPIKRIADPANLESDFPAIKKAAEVKQAEDMKLQKIKAIKYLAKIGCGCYDKDGEITEALIAATDDCTPAVREAALEAIEDAASGECCRQCGSTSCCNEQVTKRLSEMAYERDDTGCPIEPNVEIRKLAARVLKRCCPGGPPTGPIEEEIEEDAGELIPAPEPEEEEPPISESGEGDDEMLEEGGSDEFDMDDEAIDPTADPSDDPYQDDPIEANIGFDHEAINVSAMQPPLVQPENEQGVRFRFDDASFEEANSDRDELLTDPHQLRPVNRLESTVPDSGADSAALPQRATKRWLQAGAPVVTAPIEADSRLIRRDQSAAIHLVQPIAVDEVVSAPPTGASARLGLQPTVVREVVPPTVRSPQSDHSESIMIHADRAPANHISKVMQAGVSERSQEIIFDVAPKAEQMRVPAAPVSIAPTASAVDPNQPLVAQVVSVNLTSGHVMLRGPNLQSLARKAEGSLYRRSDRGYAKITGITVVRVEDGNVRVRVSDRTMLNQVQLGDHALFH